MDFDYSCSSVSDLAKLGGASPTYSPLSEDLEFDAFFSEPVCVPNPGIHPIVPENLMLPDNPEDLEGLSAGNGPCIRGRYIPNFGLMSVGVRKSCATGYLITLECRRLVHMIEHDKARQPHNRAARQASEHHWINNIRWYQTRGQGRLDHLNQWPHLFTALRRE